MQDTIYPPYRAIPFEIVSQRGLSHTFCLVFLEYRASIAEIPIAPPLRMLSKGETLKKNRKGGIAPDWPDGDTKNPIARNRRYR